MGVGTLARMALLAGLVGAGPAAAAGTEVSVDRVSGSVIGAYARFHAEGLPVSVPGTWTLQSGSPPAVSRSIPGPGSQISRGTTVTLYLAKSRPQAAVARPIRSILVPRFIGERVSAAYTWALRHRIPISVRLSPLRSGNAPMLLANYLIRSQRPAAGRPGLSLTVAGAQPPPPQRAVAAPAPVSPPPPPAPPPPTATPAPPPPPQTFYTNPVYPSAPFPDPFVLDNGNTHSDYWAFATGFLFPILRSSDLVHWSPEGTALASAPTWVGSGDWHPWSPSVIQSPSPCPGASSGGCYVMYYVGVSATYNRDCIGVATSSTPGGPYQDHGPLALPGGGASMPIGCGDADGVGNIDPSPFTDITGKTYLYVSTSNACKGGASCTFQPTISVIPLSSDLLQAADARTALFSGDSGGWEAADTSTPVVEGPSMELHDGTYYLFYSGGSYRHAYGMGYATSNSPTGTFTKAPANPIFTSTANAFSVGGGDRLVTGPHGGLWMVYAARTTLSVERTIWIDPFAWKPASTPGAPDVPVVSGPSTGPQTIQP